MTQKLVRKSELGFEAKLFAAADKLRNNVDPSEYKHVVLGLIFLKYISDAFEEVHELKRDPMPDTKIEGLDTYILPRDPGDYDILVGSLRVPPRGTDVDLVIGVRGGPIAAPDLCNGLMVPIAFDQIYSFDVDSLIKSIPKPRGAEAKKLSTTADELLNRIMQLADNVGVPLITYQCVMVPYIQLPLICTDVTFPCLP